MKKLLSLVLALSLLLTGCASGKENSAQVITDPKLLENFWEEYLDDTAFTISYSWDDPDSISPNDLCTFLALKMQRNGEELPLKDEGYVEVDKLNVYFDRYFTGDYDFTRLKSKNCYYDEEKDAVKVNFYDLYELPNVGYDDMEQFPHFALQDLTFHGDGRVVARLCFPDYRLPVKDKNGAPLYGQNNIYTDITFMAQKDNSYKFLSSEFIREPLEGAKIEGFAKEVPIIENLPDYTFTGIMNDGSFPLFEITPDGLSVLTADIETGKLKEISKESLYDVHIINKGDRLYSISAEYPDFNGNDTGKPVFSLSEITLDGKNAVNIELPSPCDGIYDISSDGNKLIYRENIDGNFFIYDFTSKEKTEIPDTDAGQKTSDILDDSFQRAFFADDDRLAILYKVGKEWGTGFGFYNIETGEYKFLSIGTSYGGAPVITPAGLYVGGTNGEDLKGYYHSFVPFDEVFSQKADEEKEIELPSCHLPENFRYAYRPLTTERFIPLLMDVQKVRPSASMREPLCTMAVVVLDTESLTMKDTGARLTRPYDHPLTLSMMPDGNLYLSDIEISKENAYIIANPYL